MGGEETETFRSFLAARWSEVVEAWANVSCGQRIGWVVGLLLFSPFLVEGSGVVLALAVFLPVALLAGLIEHFIPPLWFLLTLFIHIGGVADVVTDLALLGRALKIYFEGQFDGEEEGLERELLLVRVILTIIGAAPFILLVAMIPLMDAVTKTKEDLAADSAKAKQNTSSNSSGWSSGGVLGIFLAIMLWKVIVAGMRVLLVFMIPYDFYRRWKKQSYSKECSVIMELFLLLDLIWSGIPLGVLTALQLFYYEEEKLDLTDQQQAWEFVKLLAVGIDIIFAAYLIYFEISGLSLCLFSHHHDEHHYDPVGNEEEEGVVITRNRRDTYNIQEKLPLLAIEDHDPVIMDPSGGVRDDGNHRLSMHSKSEGDQQG